MARTDYSRSKYQDAVTEQASIAALDGTSPTAGDLSEGRDWYALVTLTAEDVVAIDALDPEYAHDFRGMPRSARLTVGSQLIIREDSQGFVWTDYGPVHPTGDPAAYRALLAAWDAIVASDAGEDDGDAGLGGSVSPPDERGYVRLGDIVFRPDDPHRCRLVGGTGESCPDCRAEREEEADGDSEDD